MTTTVDTTSEKVKDIIQDLTKEKAMEVRHVEKGLLMMVGTVQLATSLPQIARQKLLEGRMDGMQDLTRGSVQDLVTDTLPVKMQASLVLRPRALFLLHLPRGHHHADLSFVPSEALI